jgi:uncharacterized DUF497 family protein
MRIQRVLVGLSFAAALLAATAARADKHIFIIATNADGYGVDRCLATGGSCGTRVATAYCQAHEYEQVLSVRKVDRAEITGALPADSNACEGGRCDDLVVIECTR